jgi:amino acid transporter
MNEGAGLRSGSLHFVEVLAASVALIGLSMTPVLIAPLMYSSAGKASWLAFLFGGVMLIFVALNLNQFTRRSASVGSMYTYAATHLGRDLGALAGWSLIWAYVLVAVAQFGAMSLFANQLLKAVAGVQIPAAAVSILMAAVLASFAYTDVRLSTILMIALEGASVSIICLLIGIVFFRHGLTPDPQQMQVKGITPTAVGLGVATAIFSLVGFESATAFGAEARNPLRTIPRAVIWSVAIASVFFIVAMYAEIVGLRSSSTPLDKLDAPLATLADLLSVGYLKIPITIGAFFSSFAVALACVNTCARIIFPMAQQRLLPPQATAVHPKHLTPHVSVYATTALMLVAYFIMLALHYGPIDVFNNSATLSAFGFIVIYALISIAAPLYLKSIGELRPLDVVLAAAALLFLIVPAVTLVYPIPDPPVRYFPYVFAAYLAAGFWWFKTRPAASRV